MSSDRLYLSTRARPDQRFFGTRQEINNVNVKGLRLEILHRITPFLVKLRAACVLHRGSGKNICAVI